MRQVYILLVGSALVLGLGVYLFHEVRLTPAQASAPVPGSKKADDKPKPDEAKADPPAPETAPEQPKARQPLRHRDTTVKPEPEVPPPSDPAEAKANPKQDALMDEANKAYDHGEFEEAKTLALKILSTTPTNVRMLRVMVSAACVDGDSIEAQKYYAQLPPQDRGQMKTRCDRYGVTFTDVPPPAK